MAYSKREPVKAGETFESNNWGTVQVIDYINANAVVCAFDDTGNIESFSSSALRRGLVVDKAARKQAALAREDRRKADAAKRLYNATGAIRERNAAELMARVFESEHCGPFVVTEYKNAVAVTVTFSNTGHQVETTRATLLGRDRPRLRDPGAPSVFGVGRNGVGCHKPHVKGGNDSRPYSIWRAMLRRCYGNEDRPAYRGATVCEEWLDFQAFADWYEANHPGTPGLELDKDIKIRGNKVYGPHACQFVTKEANLSARNF